MLVSSSSLHLKDIWLFALAFLVNTVWVSCGGCLSGIIYRMNLEEDSN